MAVEVDLHAEAPEFVSAFPGELRNALETHSEFRAKANLVDWLLRSLPEMGGLGLPMPSGYDEHVAALKAWKQASAEWSEVAPTGRGGNPVGGQFAQFPICAFLLQPPEHSIERQAKQLKLLCLNAALMGATGMAESAKKLRKAIAPGTAEAELAMRLPEGPLDGAYVDALQACLSKLDGEPRLAERKKDILAAIHRLLVSHAKVSTFPAGQSVSRSRACHDLKGHLPLGGSVQHRSTQARPPAGEAPRGVLLFRSNREGDDETITEAEVDAAARQSARWVQRHEKLVPGDYGRFDKVERGRLATILRDGCSDENPSTRLAAGILALSYATGHRPNEVLRMPFGTQGALTPYGTFIRSLSRPDNAYSPSPEAEAFTIECAETVELELPDFIAQWLGHEPEAEKSGPLLDCLHTTQGALSSRLDHFLEHLRDDGRFRRIRVERIAAALSLELTLVRNDPALTHLLSASPSQSPPVLSYYVAYPIELLQLVFRQVMTRMLGPVCQNC